jgi:hypothetical protein
MYEVIFMSSQSRTHKFIPPTPAQFAAATAWVERFEQQWLNPNPDHLAELKHPDTQNLIPPMTKPANRQEVVEFFRTQLTRVPDFKLEVIRWAPTGDTVMIEWEATARIKETPLTWRGIDRVSLRDGRTYAGQVFWDTRRVAEQLAAAAQGA